MDHGEVLRSLDGQVRDRVYWSDVMTGWIGDVEIAISMGGDCVLCECHVEPSAVDEQGHMPPEVTATQGIYIYRSVLSGVWYDQEGGWDHPVLAIYAVDRTDIA